ncbi:MAG: GldG family protein [Oceanidesulfovibrio sp.]
MLKRLSMTILTGLIAIALLVGVNVLASKRDWRWDATSNKRYSLSEASKAALETLPESVHAVAFFRPTDGAEQTEDLLELFAGRTERFTYEIVDPDRAPFRAKQLDVRQTGVVVVQSDGRTEKVVYPTEETLLNAVVKATTRTENTVGVVTGHGELDVEAPGGRKASVFKELLTDQGAVVEPFTLAIAESVPEDVDLLLILGPAQDFMEHELDVLDDYVNRGGRLFVALMPEGATNLEPWLAERFGLRRQEGFVVDTLSQVMTGDAMTPLAQQYARMPITRDFALMTLYPTAGALAAAESNATGTEGDARPQGLVFSGEQTWLESDIQGLLDGTAEFNEDEDLMGPFWLGAFYMGAPHPTADGQPAGDNATEPTNFAAATNGTTGAASPPIRAVFFADQDFLTDDFITIGGNKDLARNSLNWLLEREGLISVDKPKPVTTFLVLTPLQRTLLTYVPVIVVPGVCLVLAVVVALRRRRTRTAKG